MWLAQGRTRKQLTYKFCHFKCEVHPTEVKQLLKGFEHAFLNIRRLIFLFEQLNFTVFKMYPSDGGGIANSVKNVQIPPLGAV